MMIGLVEYSSGEFGAEFEGVFFRDLFFATRALESITGIEKGADLATPFEERLCGIDRRRGGLRCCRFQRMAHDWNWIGLD